MTQSSRKVLRSIESPDGALCVDLFLRGDGSYGFQEYRREVDGDQPWQPLGATGDRSFPTLEEARVAAGKAVPWLEEVETR